MGEIVNLRRARKTRARGAAEATAATNRAAFGRTKVERDQAAAETARVESDLDGARRDR